MPTKPARRRGLATRVFVDGVDLSCHLTEASVDVSRDSVAAPPWYVGGPMVSLPGALKASLSINGFYSVDTDGATKLLLRSLAGVGQYSLWVIQEEGYGSNRQFTALAGLLTSYREARTVADMVKFSATVEASGWLAKGVSAFNVNSQQLLGTWATSGLSAAYLTQRSTLTQGPTNIALSPAQLQLFTMVRNNQAGNLGFYVGQAQNADWSGTNAQVMTATLAPGQLYAAFSSTTGTTSTITATTPSYSRYSPFVVKRAMLADTAANNAGQWGSSRGAMKSGHALRSGAGPRSTVTSTVTVGGSWDSLANYIAVSASGWPGTSATGVAVANPFFVGVIDPALSFLPANLN